MRTITHMLDGRPWRGAPEGTSPVFDPATGEQTGEVLLASPADVDEVVGRARLAAAAWGATSLGRRATVLFAFRQALLDASDDVAALISAEAGKVPGDALGEVARGLECVEFACGVAHHLKGQVAGEVSTGIDVHEERSALGVVVGITPFNFPAMVPLWMCANAIACGNAFILSPSEKDPSPSNLLAELWTRAGLPEGVFSVLHGSRPTAEALIAHPGVDAVSFVGSTPAARAVYTGAAAAGKRVQALGGAKNHLVVLPDADLDAAADAAVSAAFGSSGQRCMAVSVLVPVGGIADELVAAVAKRAAELRVGPASQAGAEMGPLINAAQRERVASYVEQGVSDGGRLVLDGRETLFDRGFFIAPSVLDEVSTANACYRDEVFGPLLSVVRRPGLDDALALVNQGPYGNGAAVFTSDGAAARDFARRVHCGMVGVNVPIPVPTGAFSFGGWRSSLFGDSNMYGPEGIRFYTRTKTVTTRWPERAAPSQVTLNFPTGSS